MTAKFKNDCPITEDLFWEFISNSDKIHPDVLTGFLSNCFMNIGVINLDIEENASYVIP